MCEVIANLFFGKNLSDIQCIKTKLNLLCVAFEVQNMYIRIILKNSLEVQTSDVQDKLCIRYGNQILELQAMNRQKVWNLCMHIFLECIAYFLR